MTTRVVTGELGFKAGIYRWTSIAPSLYFNASHSDALNGKSLLEVSSPDVRLWFRFAILRQSCNLYHPPQNRGQGVRGRYHCLRAHTTCGTGLQLQILQLSQLLSNARSRPRTGLGLPAQGHLWLFLACDALTISNFPINVNYQAGEEGR